jgi:hypothetical protein
MSSGGAPSATAGKALQVYVSRLRRALGADALETRAPGYRIRIQDGALCNSRAAASMG